MQLQRVGRAYIRMSWILIKTVVKRLIWLKKRCPIGSQHVRLILMERCERRIHSI